MKKSSMASLNGQSSSYAIPGIPRIASIHPPGAKNAEIVAHHFV
jgi:hypothetical protein